jgi:hypothetical protein
MTLDFHPAVVNMLKCYKNSIQPGGACLHPFMVFCNSAILAEFFCRLLRTTATQCNANTTRIKGIWSQIKHTDDFCKRFAREQNIAALDADVIVCTSVIGAGFSINRHFESFHAFCCCDILTFQEETQFIQRLRFLLQDVPAAAIRQSYLYVQQGRGSQQDFAKVRINFEHVRQILISNAASGGQREFRPVTPITALADTEARVHTERSATRSLHPWLWITYGNDVLRSDFGVSEFKVTKEELA